MDMKKLFELAGVDVTKGKAKTLLEGSGSRFDQLLGYYTDGVGGFSDDPTSKRIKKYVSGINGGSIKRGTPEYETAKSAILSYGSDVGADELKNY